jgi:hypothetical protein
VLDPRLVLEAARLWLGAIHGQSPGHLLICSTGDWAGKAFLPTDVDQALGYIAALDQAGREGIYLRITSVGTPPEAGRRGGAADSAALPALWADLDLAGPGHAEQDLPPDEAAGRAIIAATGLPEPTIWVHSGGGLYPIWLLEQPHTLTADNLDDAKRLAKDWQRVIEHAAASLGWRYGRGVGDLARVLRIPGTVNRKEGLARPCRIISAQNLRYSYRQLVDALDVAIARITPATVPTVPLSTAASIGAVARPAGSVSPLDDFAARTEWAAILTPAGWREHYQQDDITYWTRPGKTTGISASTNALGTDRLYVHSTAAAPLDGGESYSKGGAYAVLHHGGDHSAAVRELAAKGYGTPLPSPAVEYNQALTDIIGAPLPEPPPEPPPRPWIAEVDVSNTAMAAEWLRNEIGRRRLAGMFLRGPEVVHTPREGEEGYVALGDEDDEDGPAQVRIANDSTLASRVGFTYGIYRMQKIDGDYEPVPALFPRTAARAVLDVPDLLPNLRRLRGVIHTPAFRADGSLINAPGYDPTTGLLYLPEPGLVIPRVADEPTTSDVTDAVKLLLEMIDGFPFVADAYRANYLGMLLTPLQRGMAPPPYKLHAIEAHQPGSGKTLLANLARIIHGGVFRAEMPEDDAELRKQITAILLVTTGPVVVIDNVSGALNSSALAGLLTSDEWDDRVLGATEIKRGINDRIWTVTGNNINIGGDLPRRTIRTVIDPGMPNPEKRTGFAISDLEGWTRSHRGELLHALLTIVRAWASAGRPVPPEKASDGYARWTRTVAGILAHAGIPGGFDDESTRIEVGGDDDEWGGFLEAVHRTYGDQVWTVKELVGDIGSLPSSRVESLINPGRISFDALPSALADKAARHPHGAAGIAKSLGRWLANREGRWAGGRAVRCVGMGREKAKQWQIVTMEAKGTA